MNSFEIITTSLLKDILMTEKLGPTQDIAFTLHDHKLFNTRPLPVGFTVAYTHRDLKAFLAYSDSRKIRKNKIVSDCNFDDMQDKNAYGIIAVYTDFLPDNFIIEQSGNLFDKDTESFELNLCCITGEPNHHKSSQRLVLLEGELSEAIIDSGADMTIFMHYDNATWDGVYWDCDAVCSIRPLISPNRIRRPENPLSRLVAGNLAKPAR